MMTQKMCRVQNNLNRLLKTVEEAEIIKTLQNFNKIAEILNNQNSPLKQAEQAEQAEVPFKVVVAER